MKASASDGDFTQLSMSGPVDPDRYAKLLQEYSKIKKNNVVLKKAILQVC